MRDNVVLSDVGVAADAFAANAIAVNKTAADGVWLMLHVTKTGADADERLDITIYGKDADAGWVVTDDKVAVAQGQIGNGLAQNGVVIKYVLVQTDHLYIKPYYDVTGTTPGFTIVCSLVTGPSRDWTV